KDTAVFGLNNAAFSVSVGTPSGSALSDIVQLGYLAITAVNSLPPENLGTIFEYSTSGPNGPFYPCTELQQPPDDTHLNGGAVSATVSGRGHTFLWNAYQDLIVAPPHGTVVTASSNIIVRVQLVRSSTQVMTQPSRTRAFSVDERLV